VKIEVKITNEISSRALKSRPLKFIGVARGGSKGPFPPNF